MTIRETPAMCILHGANCTSQWKFVITLYLMVIDKYFCGLLFALNGNIPMTTVATNPSVCLPDCHPMLTMKSANVEKGASICLGCCMLLHQSYDYIMHNT